MLPSRAMTISSHPGSPARPLERGQNHLRFFIHWRSLGAEPCHVKLGQDQAESYLRIATAPPFGSPFDGTAEMRFSHRDGATYPFALAAWLAKVLG